ncbi:MAG: hypothetical protein FWG49_08105 [Leptospirales bacterium]|nr:hypothetical protein [Leptospirales bacterium]
MRHLFFIMIFLLMSCIVFGKPAKTMYLASFEVHNYDRSGESIAAEIRDYMSESLVSSYSLISDDEVKVVLGNAGLNQLMGGSSAGSLKQLGAKINADCLVYGKVMINNVNEEKNIYKVTISATRLDIDSGLSKTERISFVGLEYTDWASRALGEALTDKRSGKNAIEKFEKDVAKFEKDMQEVGENLGKKFEDKDDSVKRRDESLIRSPRIRIGGSYGGMFRTTDAYINKLYDQNFLVMLDFFFYRYKDPVGDGVDLYLRGTYRRFTISESAIPDAKISATEYKNRIGYFSSTPDKNSLLSIYSGDIGVRWVGSKYLLGSTISLYLNVASRYNYAIKDPKVSGEEKVPFTQWGIVGGTGVEISLIRYLGLFAEFNMGYVPMGEDKINFEGPQVIAGITFRTNHWE